MIVWSKESQGGVRQLVGVHIEGKAEELPGTAAFSRETKPADCPELAIQESGMRQIGGAYSEYESKK